MISSGLLSITFRKLTVPEIIGLVREAKLDGIEWGGDIHVPHGNLKLAAETRARTLDAGLQTSCYGSYFRLGNDRPDAIDFAPVLETAQTLGAPAIRVWAGTRGSAEADENYRGRVAQEAVAIANQAAKADIEICYEYHGGTLTDEIGPALDLMGASAHPHIVTGWQPAVGRTPQEREATLLSLLPHVRLAHVFQWDPKGVRLPLSDGTAEWSRYFEILKRSPKCLWASLEFVMDDSPEVFLEDARTLRSLLG